MAKSLNRYERFGRYDAGSNGWMPGTHDLAGQFKNQVSLGLFERLGDFITALEQLTFW
ncbi:hypothetical protein D3C76_1657270 [compost metagenome]